MELYKINEEMLKILNKEELDEKDYELFDKLQLKLEDKWENIIKYSKELEAEANKFDNEIKRLLDRKKRLSNKADWLIKYLDNQLKSQEIEKVSFWSFDLSYRPSYRVIENDNIEKISSEYIKEKITKSVDKVKAKKDLRDWKEIEGLHLETIQNLQIN